MCSSLPICYSYHPICRSSRSYLSPTKFITTMAPLYHAIASILLLLVSLPRAFTSSDFAAQRIPFGGSLFQLEPRNVEVRADTGDNDCGGASGCTTTPWGCQCGFTDGSWIEDDPPSKPSPLPTNVPGSGGVPSCAYVIYPDGQACVDADYCNCGGTPAPLLTATVDGKESKDCNYKTVPTSECPKPTKAPAPPSPPAPPKLDDTLKCTPTNGSGDAKMFSLSKVKDQITKVCQAYVDDGLVLNFDGHSFEKQLKYLDLGEAQGLSEHDSTLVIGLDHSKANCADVNDAKPLDFKALGVEKCEENFMRVVDGCPNFENPNGLQYWKWRGKNQLACAFWTVIAS